MPIFGDASYMNTILRVLDIVFPSKPSCCTSWKKPPGGVLSIMWNVRATIVFPKSLRQLNLRHCEADLSNVELVVVYGEGSHYSAIGKYLDWCRVLWGLSQGLLGHYRSFTGWSNG